MYPLSAQQPQPQPQASVAGAPPVDATPLPEAGRDPGAAGGVVSTGDFIRMVVVLAAVLGAIYLLFRLIRRGAAGRHGNSELIAVLGSRSLGGNRSLHLVRAAGGYYLVGAGDQAVNLVAEITDPERLDLLAEHPAGQGASARSRFADLLAEAGIGTPSATRTADSGHTAFLRRQRDRVRHQRDRVRRLGRAPAVEEKVRAAT